MKKYLSLLTFITLASCTNAVDKDEFIKESLSEKFQKDSCQLISYSVSGEDTKDEVTSVYYRAKIQKGSAELTVKDTLLYTVTGDGFYIYQ